MAASGLTATLSINSGIPEDTLTHTGRIWTDLTDSRITWVDSTDSGVAGADSTGSGLAGADSIGSGPDAGVLGCSLPSRLTLLWSHKMIWDLTRRMKEGRVVAADILRRVKDLPVFAVMHIMGKVPKIQNMQLLHLPSWQGVIQNEVEDLLVIEDLEVEDCIIIF